ncbi:MAG: glycosyltransferase family 39 protein [Crocinitomicaceae bacterium]
MDKTLTDLIISLLFMGGLIAVIYFFRKQKFRISLGVILVLGLLLRVYLSTDNHLHKWDERYHALVAKNLADHPLKPTLFEHHVMPVKGDDWTGTHLWLSKPPVPLWTMAVSMKVFGANTWGVRMPSILFSTLAIFITFLLGKKLFGEQVAIVAAFLHAINGLVIESAAGRVSSDHVETFFIIFVELAVYFVVLSIDLKKAGKWIFLAGVFTGLAFLSKWFPALIVWPIWLLAFVTSRHFSWKNLFIYGGLLVAGTTLIALPWLIIVNGYGDDILMRVLFAFSETIQFHDHPRFYFFHQIMIIFGELIYIPIFLGIYLIAKKKSVNQLLLLLVWIVIPLIAFTLGETKRHTYILIAAPAFFLLVAYVANWMLVTYHKTKLRWVAFVVAFALIALPIRYMTERLKLFQASPELSEFYQNKPQWEDQFTQKDVVFGLQENIDLMFYTDVHAAYQYLPSQETVLRLQKEGFSVVIYSNGSFFTRKPLFLDVGSD